jgi:hypothetical protein
MRDEVTESGENYIKRSSLICTAHQILFGYQIEKNETGGTCSKGERRGAYRVLVGRPEGKRTLGRHKYRWEDNIKMDLQKWDGAWTGLIWLGIGTGGGLL